jgi:Fe-S cluster assembly protein SufD
MNEIPVVVSRTRRVAPAAGSFNFTAEMIPDVSSPTLAAVRRHAWDVFKSLPMPTLRDEAWRRTDLHMMPMDRFMPASRHANGGLAQVPDALLQPVADEAHGGQVILTPGKASVHLAEELSAKGVIFTDFRTAERQYPDLVAKYVNQIVRPEEGKFAALAGALAETGIFLYVPKGVKIAQPLHSLLWGPGTGLAHLSHVLVCVEEGASVTYVHEMASDTEVEQSLHTGLVEVYVGRGAQMHFVELQSWGQHVWNFTHERVRVERDATLDWIFGSVGSHLTKNFSELELAGEGSTGKMSGFYFTNHDQHLDHDTQQNHLAPNTTSDLLFKGALQDESRSVWQGMIYVAPGAFKTDGYQANRNLVLSPHARADSIPGLEILADDVRCTHGATVGKVDKDQVFYLRSRGIPADEAEQLIVEGFFDPIMQRIPFEGVRERFQAAIHEKMTPDIIATAS